MGLQLQERGPLKALERGYSIATDAAGNVLRSAEQVVVGDLVGIRLHQGYVETTVTRKE